MTISSAWLTVLAVVVILGVSPIVNKQWKIDKEKEERGEI